MNASKCGRGKDDKELKYLSNLGIMSTRQITPSYAIQGQRFTCSECHARLPPFPPVEVCSSPFLLTGHLQNSGSRVKPNSQCK